jgi:hypothetical protein
MEFSFFYFTTESARGYYSGFEIPAASIEELFCSTPPSNSNLGIRKCGGFPAPRQVAAIVTIVLKLLSVYVIT